MQDGSGPRLPAQRTPLIGRKREIAEARHLLLHAETCLVTLTGAGGSGKTRLALQVAAELAPDFPQRVWLVELAPIADPVLVPQTVAAALGIQEATGRSFLDALAAFLAPEPALLVLDNCEHLVDACASLAEQLLAACPDLRILATSREPLQIAGERQRRVPPLAVPDLDHLPALAELAQAPAVRLFVERAQAVDPEFFLTPRNAAVVARVCARVDGLPLALELAAARVRVLAVEQILARLDDAVRLLTGGSRAGPTRQQTLRATLEWGEALLTEAERAVFRRLAVFAGGWTLEAAEAVCAEGEGRGARGEGRQTSRYPRRDLLLSGHRPFFLNQTGPRRVLLVGPRPSPFALRPTP